MADELAGTDPIAQARFVTLDAMRGVACIIIILYHGTEGIVPLAYPAVDLFFLLSGFVLAHRYGASLARGEDRRGFAIGRLIRFYPLYLVGTALGAIVTWAMIGPDMEGWGRRWFAVSVMAAPFFIPTPTPSWLGIFPLNGPAWSLFFELVANSLFLWTGWRVRPAIAILLVSAPLLLWAMATWPGAGGFSHDDFFGGFPRVAFSFFAGVLLYRLWRSGRLPRSRAPVWLFPLLMLALYAWQPVAETAYFAIVVFIVQPVLIWFGASSEPSARAQPAMLWLGAVSYGTYVLHCPIQLAIESISRPRLGLDWNASTPGWWVLLTLPLSFLLSHWLTFRFDEPLRRHLRARLLCRPPPPHPIAAPA